jgi:DNA-binding NarL/FixJ family response regulator
VPKHSQRPVFAAALDCIAGGGVFVPEDFSFSGAKGVDEALRRMSSLTPQQARILSLVCDGKLNKQIAWDMSIAEATVKAHVTAIMRKLAVQSRTQAVLIAQNARFDFLKSED